MFFGMFCLQFHSLLEAPGNANKIFTSCILKSIDGAKSYRIHFVLICCISFRSKIIKVWKKIGGDTLCHWWYLYSPYEDIIGEWNDKRSYEPHKKTPSVFDEKCCALAESKIPPFSIFFLKKKKFPKLFLQRKITTCRLSPPTNDLLIPKDQADVNLQVRRFFLRVKQL